MILSTFRNNQLTASFLLIFYAVALHIPAFWQGRLSTIAPDPGAAYFGEWMAATANWGVWTSLLIPVALLFVTAIGLNQLSARDHLSAEVTQLPGLFYILVGSFAAAFFLPHSVQLANMFLLIALFPFLTLYKKHDIITSLFWTGWWLGIAFLVNRYFILFLPAFVVSLPVLTTLTLRRILQLVSGWLAPLFLLASFSYMRNNLSGFLEEQFYGYGWPLRWVEEPRWAHLSLIVLGVCMLWALFSYGSNAQVLRTAGRKRLNIFYSILLFAGLSLLIQPELAMSSAQIAVLPLGAILGFQFSRYSRSSGETLHLLILAAFIALQLYPFFLQ